MKKNILIAVLLVIVGAGGTFMYLNLNRPPKSSVLKPDTAFCTEHQIAEKDCPWCNASLIEKMGMCPEHGVPEALCSRCNLALIPGFKAEKDWCAGHGLPESQCVLCKGGQLPPGEVSYERTETSS
jgi:hypothetical protein